MFSRTVQSERVRGGNRVGDVSASSLGEVSSFSVVTVEEKCMAYRRDYDGPNYSCARSMGRKHEGIN